MKTKNRSGENILDLLAMPNAGEVKFEPPRLTGVFYRAADLTNDSSIAETDAAPTHPSPDHPPKS